MSVKCGNAKTHPGTTHHDSVSAVRACYRGALDTDLQSSVYARQATTPTEQAAKVAKWDAELPPSHPSINDDQRGVLARLRRQALAEGATGRPSSHGELITEHLQHTVPVTPEERREHACRNGMTLKQYDFLLRLIAERETPLVETDLDGLYRNQASTAIGRLVDTPRRQAYVADTHGTKQTVTEDTKYATEDGIYRNPENGQIFKAQFNRATGDGRRLYAKRLGMSVLENGEWNTYLSIPLDGKPTGRHTFEWDYVGSTPRAGVLAVWKVTQDEAKAFGALYGRCIRCHRELTKEESIERMMGDTCAGKMGF